MAGTVEGFRAYATARGNAAPADASTTDVTAALVRATDYITHHYLNRMVAEVSVDQEDLESATYEAAILELGTPDFFNKTFTPDQQKVLTEVRGIKWTVRGDASGSKAATPVSTRIEAIFFPYTFSIGVLTA